MESLLQVDGLRIMGPNTMDSRGASLAFTVGEIHPHDLGQFLDSQGIAVRTGHHCAWPLNKKMGVQSTTRASFYLYNTLEDCDALVSGIRDAQKYFGR
jgi:cysteine desulfurase/selenocysteine lyase